MYIIFEGIDGSGKSTQCDLLGQSLIRIGYTPIHLQEPSYGQTGRLIRRLINTTSDLEAGELHKLFTRDREEHVRDKINPLLRLVNANTKFVLLQDRGYLSAPAYQAENSQDVFSMLAEQQAIAPRPDMFIYIDVDEKEAMRRIGEREAGKTVFESEQRLRLIRERYKLLLNHHFECIVEFDGTLKRELLHDRICDIVLRELRGGQEFSETSC